MSEEIDPSKRGFIKGALGLGVTAAIAGVGTEATAREDRGSLEDSEAPATFEQPPHQKVAELFVDDLLQLTAKIPDGLIPPEESREISKKISSYFGAFAATREATRNISPERLSPGFAAVAIEFALAAMQRPGKMDPRIYGILSWWHRDLRLKAEENNLQAPSNLIEGLDPSRREA